MIPKKSSKGGQCILHYIFCGDEGDEKDAKLQIRKKNGNVMQMECS